MIAINHTPKFSVLRLAMYDQEAKAFTCQRLIGTYESLNEANFIAHKAEKMEKASVLSSMIEKDPSKAGIRLSNVVLGDVIYKVTKALNNVVTPLYTNGVSNIVHHMKENNPHEKRIAKEESNSNMLMSFEDFVLLRESNVNLRSKRCKDWTTQDIMGGETDGQAED